MYLMGNSISTQASATLPSSSSAVLAAGMEEGISLNNISSTSTNLTVPSVADTIQTSRNSVYAEHLSQPSQQYQSHTYGSQPESFIIAMPTLKKSSVDIICKNGNLSERATEAISFDPKNNRESINDSASFEDYINASFGGISCSLQGLTMPRDSTDVLSQKLSWSMLLDKTADFGHEKVTSTASPVCKLSQTFNGLDLHKKSLGEIKSIPSSTQISSIGPTTSVHTTSSLTKAIVHSSATLHSQSKTSILSTGSPLQLGHPVLLKQVSSISNSSLSNTNPFNSSVYVSSYQQAQKFPDEPEFRVARRKLTLSGPNYSTFNKSAALHGKPAIAMHLKKLSKCNSCSTLFVNSTISKADLEETLMCVAAAIVSIVQRNKAAELYKTHDIFSEELHPLSRTVRIARLDHIPTEDDVYGFLHSLFEAAQLTAECAIIMLIYIERMLINTNLAIQACNWSRVLLGGLILASKVWDDQAVWNVDFCTIFPDVSVRDMNDLERFYINAICYNVGVKGSLFARYYFDLRDLASDRNLGWSLKPLTIRQASRLEAITHASQLRLLDGLGHSSVQVFSGPNSNCLLPSPLKLIDDNNGSNVKLEATNLNKNFPQMKVDLAAPPSLHNDDVLRVIIESEGTKSKSKVVHPELKLNAALKVNVKVGSLRRAVSDNIFEPSSPAVIM